MYHSNPYARSIYSRRATNGPYTAFEQPKLVTSELYLKQPVKPVDASLYLAPQAKTVTSPLGPLMSQKSQYQFDAQGMDLGPLQMAQDQQAANLGPLQMAQGQQADAQPAQGQAATSPMNSYPLALSQGNDGDSTYLSPTHYMPVDTTKKGSGAGLLALLGGLALLALNKR